ncbi:MAG: YwiC-like family protein [Actinomycetes bacterium]
MAAAPTASSPRSWARTYVPPQHGVWAMLVVPFVLGTAASSAGWWTLPLLVVWVDAYLVSYYALLGLKARRLARYRAPLRLYTVVLVVVSLPLVAMRPWLVAAAVAFVPLVLLNAWFAYRRDDRNWLNGVVSVTQACLIVFVAYGLGEGVVTAADLSSVEWSAAVQLFVAAWLYFTGTVLFVKTMIREAGESSYYRASVAYHLVACLLAALVDPWLALPFGLYLVRAVALPRHRLRPAQVGVVEVVDSVLLVVVALLTT